MQNDPITVFGEVLFDQFPDGANVLGGAPFNVAWHLKALNLSAVLEPIHWEIKYVQLCNDGVWTLIFCNRTCDFQPDKCK